MTNKDPVSISKYFEELTAALDSLSRSSIAEFITVLRNVRREDNNIFIIGNGGSASTASHMATDLSWTLMRSGAKPFKTIALTENSSFITASANDEDFSQIFSHQISTYGKENDVLVAISASGNSPNITKALQQAKTQGMTTVGMLGMGGGEAISICDIPILINSNKYGIVEDVHLAINHSITEHFKSRDE